MKSIVAIALSITLAAPLGAQTLSCMMTHNCANRDACADVGRAFDLVLRDTEADLVVDGALIITFTSVVTSHAGTARGVVTMTSYDPAAGGAVASLHPQGHIAVTQHYSGTEVLNTGTLYGSCDMGSAR